MSPVRIVLRWTGDAVLTAPQGFYINFPIGGLAAIVILLVHIPDRRVHCDGSAFQIFKSRFDLVGFALFAPWSIMLLLALEYGGSKYPWSSPNVIGLFVGGFLAFVVFFFWERRQGEGAMTPFPIIRKREIWTSCLSMMFLFTTIFAASYYLPMYFQAVMGASPLTSGVYMLPSILSQLIFAVVSGLLSKSRLPCELSAAFQPNAGHATPAQRVGYYLPFSILSASVLAIGYGLMTTFSPETETAKWVFYQIIVGVGRGLGMQVALVAIQANTAPDFIAMATATLVFCQTFGGAIFIAVANSIFNNTLKNELTDRVPAMDAELVVDAGATGLRAVAEGGELAGVLMAYSKAVDAVFYVVVATSLCMFVVSWGMGWRDIRVKPA